MRRSVSALALGFAGYGGLITAVMAVLAAGLGVLWGTGELVGFEAALSLGLVAGTFTAFGLPFLVTGWALHRRRRWARWPALVLAALIVFNAPLGTLLGGYTFYTLLDAEGLAQLDS